jgi:hypothetical protein
MNLSPKPFDLLLMVFLAGTVATGCHSTKPGSASFASVVIHNRSLPEVQQATLMVFREDGYAGAPAGADSMVFEKEGTRLNDIAYNGVIGTHYGQRSAIRVKSQIVELGGNSWRLQCQAFTVRDAGDPFFSEEIPMTNLRGAPYQVLLNKVADRLK